MPTQRARRLDLDSRQHFSLPGRDRECCRARLGQPSCASYLAAASSLCSHTKGTGFGRSRADKRSEAVPHAELARKGLEVLVVFRVEVGIGRNAGLPVDPVELDRRLAIHPLELLVRQRECRTEVHEAYRIVAGGVIPDLAQDGGLEIVDLVVHDDATRAGPAADIHGLRVAELRRYT